jgi:serine/threonine protein phosphatase 1
MRTTYDVDPRRAFDQQNDHARLWIREIFLRWTEPFPKYVVHGHTPTARSGDPNARPDIRDNRCNLDTGAGWAGPLSAAIFDDGQAKPVHTISVI